MALDTEKIRKDFPILKTLMNGKPLVYLDSAATSQKPRQVVNAVSKHYKRYNANIHRGIYKISEEATEAYVKSKETFAKFVNAGSYKEVVYCRNTTEAINLVALSLGEDTIKEGDTILLTAMEHHSNIVPWKLLADRKKAKLEFAQLKDNAFVDMDDYKVKLESNPKIVAFTHVSNVLGTINDAKEMTKLAHEHGAKVVIDGAQSAPHMPVDIKDIGCDFYACSSHKMLGPSGVGVLYGKEELLDSMRPLYGGGDMIRSVTFEECTWNDLPWKFEAGTPNIEGAVGFGAAMKYLKKTGMHNIREHEKQITQYALKRLQEVGGVRMFGPASADIDRKAGVIAFSIDGVHAHDTAQIFDSEGVAIRSGHHCAMPLVTQLLKEPAVARMSFYLYNNEADVDRAIEAIDRAKNLFKKQS